MYEGNQMEMAAKQAGALVGYAKDPMSQMTCGENLERQIAEQKERLAMLENAKERLAMLENAMEEMKATGLYNVKISTLRDTMSW